MSKPFQPDWRLDQPAALANVLQISLHRRGVRFGDMLSTDEQWAEMCEDIIAMIGTGISPMKMVDLPRSWDTGMVGIAGRPATDDETPVCDPRT